MRIVLHALMAMATMIPCCAQGSDIWELTEANFNSTVGRGADKPWFVKFYAPWCGHCKNLHPTWKSLASSLKGSVNVGRVDATSNQQLKESWEIEGFPTLKLISDGGYVYTFTGARDFAELKAYAEHGYLQHDAEPMPQHRYVPEHLLELTEETFLEAVGSGAWFVNFYLPSCQHSKNLRTRWARLADELHGSVQVAKLNAEAFRNLTETLGVNRFPTLLLIREGTLWEYTGDRSQEAMAAFALQGYRGQQPFKTIGQSGAEWKGLCLAYALGLSIALLAWRFGGRILGLLGRAKLESKNA